MVLIKLRPLARARGRLLTAADLGEGDDNEAAFKTVVWDEAAGAAAVPNGSLGFRYAESGVGKWNLDLGAISPALSCEGTDETAEVLLPRFDLDKGTGGILRRGVPVRCQEPGQRNG